MIKSLFNSAIYSISAAFISYALMIIVTRSYSTHELSFYLYIMTWGLLIVQIVDVASEQSLVHFSYSNKREISISWSTIAALKVTIILLAIAINKIISIFLYFSIPCQVLLVVVPVIYMGPIYEYYGNNTIYAKLLLFEKILLFTCAAITALLKLDIEYILYSYFIISIFSLFYQKNNCKLNVFSISPDALGDIKIYIVRYLPVYLVLMSQLVYGNVSRLIINFKIGPFAFASVTLALQIVNAISMIQSQVDRHVRPLAIQAVHRADWRQLSAIAKHYLIFYLVPIMLGCILLSAFSVSIMNLLFGSKWHEAGRALSFASPLVFTIACMRFLDILVVPLNAAKMNLLVNVTAGVSLFALLWLNPYTTLASFILMIVLCQATHVAFMSTYVYARVKRAMKQVNSGTSEVA